MTKFKTYIIQFITKETVVFISLLLAVVSCFFVTPDKEYLNYIDFRTLSILLCLMLVMAGLRQLGVFEKIGIYMLEKTSSIKSLTFVLVFLCFFFSMLITNDVALITFIPFTIEVLIMAGLEQYMIPIIVFQTIAANLGSMLTPIGNPQNLYLYSLSNMSLNSFFMLMLPFTVVSFFCLFICILLRIGKEPTEVLINHEITIGLREKKKIVMYIFLFILSLTTVARKLHYLIVLAITLFVLVLLDRQTIKKADYYLLLTFIFLFIFIGNLGRIPEISKWLEHVVKGNELITSILASQGTSNVPAAILLSGFTDNIKSLILGTNLGGLGTLIASMASLISYKFFAKSQSSSRLKYIGSFTFYNIIFLGVLLVFYYVFA